MKKHLIALALVFAVMAALALPAIADFGNYDSYDSGWDSSSSSDWSWDDDDYSSGSYYDSDSSSDDDGEGSIVGYIIVAVVIIAVVIWANRGNKKGGSGAVNNPNAGATGTVNVPMKGTYTDKTAEVEEEVRKTDEHFSSGRFIAFVKECYLKLQSAWTARDLEELRVIQSEELFSQSQTQIEEYKRMGRINVMERVAVNDVKLLEHRISGDKEYIDVLLNAQQKDYIIDEKTKAVLEGSQNQYRNINYVITFMRTVGEITDDTDGVKAANCPNCGAPLEVTAAGKCAYCGSVISSGAHTWVISAMKRA